MKWKKVLRTRQQTNKRQWSMSLLLANKIFMVLSVIELDIINDFLNFGGMLPHIQSDCDVVNMADLPLELVMCIDLIDNKIMSQAFIPSLLCFLPFSLSRLWAIENSFACQLLGVIE